MILSRTELNKRYNIGKNAWNTKHDELLDFLSEYMDIEEIKTDSNRYSYEIDGDAPESIPPIPRKSNKEQKVQDYSTFVQKRLPEEYSPLSKSKMARDAKDEFGKNKYGHEYIPSIVRRYIGPSMEQYGEHTEDWVWVDYKTYIPLTNEQIIILKQCFKKANITEEQQLSAFQEYAVTKDLPALDEKTDAFNMAVDMFKDRTGLNRPIKVHKWRKKEI